MFFLNALSMRFKFIAVSNFLANFLAKISWEEHIYKLELHLHFFSFILCFHSLRHICIHYGRVSDDSRRGHDSFTNTYLPRASPSGEAAHDAMSALRTGHIPFARLHHHRAHGVGKLTLSHALQ